MLNTALVAGLNTINDKDVERLIDRGSGVDINGSPTGPLNGLIDPGDGLEAVLIFDNISNAVFGAEPLEAAVGVPSYQLTAHILQVVESKVLISDNGTPGNSTDDTFAFTFSPSVVNVYEDSSSLANTILVDFALQSAAQTILKATDGNLILTLADSGAGANGTPDVWRAIGRDDFGQLLSGNQVNFLGALSVTANPGSVPIAPDATKSGLLGAVPGTGDFHDVVAIGEVEFPALSVLNRGWHAQTDTTVSFIVPRAALGDFVWHDLDADGIQDGGEPGIPGVTVKLFKDGVDTGQTDITDALGLYLFDNLVPGNYQVMFVAPPGYMTSPANQGVDDAIDSDGVGPSLMTAVTNLSPGETDLTLDQGLFVKGSLHGYGYEDLDADGILDGTDVAWNVLNVSKKKIDLFAADGTTLLASQLTDAAGQFWFVDLVPGTYVLKEDLGVFASDPHVMASPDPDGVGGIPGGAEARTVIIKSGEELVYQNGAAMLPPGSLKHEVLTDDGRLVFGNFLKGSIHGFGYEDLDADGNLEATDVAWNVPNVSAKKIDLFKSDGVTLIGSEFTNAAGQFWFLNLAPGTYVLKEDLSVFASDPHVMASPDPDGPGGVPGGAATRTVTITSGQELVYKDGAAMGMLKDGQEEVLVNDGRLVFGNFLKGSIHGFGYEDLDADGILDNTDVAWNVPNVSAKKIDLYAADGTTLLGSQLTDSNGQFWFLGLAPGTYVLKEDLSVFASDPHVMASPDPDGAGGVPGGAASRTVTITSGQELVYKDGAAMGMLKDGQEEVLVNDGRLVFGNFLKGSIHGFGYEDLDADGILDNTDVAWNVPGVSAKKINLYDDQGVSLLKSTFTDANGQFWFTELMPGTYVLREDLSVFASDPHVMASPDPDGMGGVPGGADERVVTITSGKELVYQNGATMGMLKDGQEEVLVNDGRLVFGNFLKGSIHGFGYEDLDADGNLDASDVAWNVPNVSPKKIDLFAADGTTLLGSQLTDAAGQFWFLNLAPGTYVLKEDLSVFASDPHVMASPDPDGPGGVPGGAASRTVTITSGQELVYQNGATMGMLKDGQEEVLVDDGRLVFGNFLKGSIHGFGYEDLDADGILDNTDVAWNVPGVSAKKIDLFAADGTTLLGSQLTDAAGQFWFLNLAPGNYVLKEDLSVFGSNVMASPDPDGPGGVPGGAASRTVTISSGQELVYKNGATMGMLKDGQEEVLVNDGRLVFGNFRKAALGDFVWHDLDADGVQDAGEPGIPNVTVNLKNSGGVVIASTVTNALGIYGFNNLTPGTYSVQFVQPGGYTGVSPANQGANDAVDSDGVPAMMLMTATTTLASGQTDLTLDQGFYKPAALGDFVWFDQDKDGLQDAGEPGVPNATVHLKNAANVIIASTVTNASGIYGFNNLTPGTYSVQFVLPAGYDAFTTANVGANDAIDSDADPSMSFMTQQVVLLSGGVNLTLDAGVIKQTPDIDIEKFVRLGPPPCFGEGLTPGFWKQSQHFDAWTAPYSPQTPAPAGFVNNYNTVFNLTAGQEDSSLTLLGALGRGGGGKNALGRHAVAALLNAASGGVEYAFSEAQVKAMVENAYDTNNFEPTKDQLAKENEKGADLNTTCATPAVGYGDDADSPTGPTVSPGGTLTFTYVVTNPGEVELGNVVVTDREVDPITMLPIGPAFNPPPVLVSGFNTGDDDQDGKLDPGEIWLYTSSYTAPTGGGGLPVSTSQMEKFLLIGTTSNAIAKAVNVQNGDLGADVIVLSTEINDNVDFDLDDVFLNNAGARWVNVNNTPNNQPDYLPGAAKVGEGVSWTGDVALTSPNAAFDMSNVELFGQVGVVADSSNPVSSVSNSLFFPNGVGTGVSPPVGGLALPPNGVTANADAAMLALRGELDAFENYVTNLVPEKTLVGGVDLPDFSGIEDVPYFELNVDPFDTNNDGLAVIDILIDNGNSDFKLTNSNWVIESTKGTLAIFRIRGGSNLVLNQSTILKGDGILGNSDAGPPANPANDDLGAIFIKANDYKNAANTGTNPGEPLNSGDTVFSFNDTVLNGVAFYDLIAFDEQNSDVEFDNGTTELKINNGQGCAQFIAPKINFNNVRFERCDAPEGGDEQHKNIADVSGATVSGAVETDSDAAHWVVGTPPPPPTKFYIVDATADDTFEYSAAGVNLNNNNLAAANTNPRDIASNPAGDRVWVINNNSSDIVYVYNDAGASLGSWTARTAAGANLNTPEGIATNGTDVWIVDDGNNTVYRYNNRAITTTGLINANSSFALINSGANVNTSPRGIATDGVHLWVVNNNGTDKVFKYTVAGAFVGAWTIDPANSTPTGITIDPANVSNIWIVDSGTDRVYQYDAAASRISGSQAASGSFLLPAGNGDAQGIADPPPAGSLAQPVAAATTSSAASAVASDAAIEEFFETSGEGAVVATSSQLPLASAAPARRGLDRVRLEGAAIRTAAIGLEIAAGDADASFDQACDDIFANWETEEPLPRLAKRLRAS
jgi:protocatechuate 3,4-dioxygenase beta subunit